MPFIFFSCLTATARIPRMTVNRVLRTHILAFFSILGGWHSVFHINYNLNDRFLIFGFWTLSCWKSSFLFLLCWYFPHGHWILSKAIFFFFKLQKWSYDVSSLVSWYGQSYWFLKTEPACIPGINPTWSWWYFLYTVIFVSILLKISAFMLIRG